MEIKNRKVLVLGGWGLVGMAICKKLINEGPSELVILSLEKRQAEDAVETLEELTDIKLTPVWGNIFVPTELKDLPRNEILENEKNRQILIRDVLYSLTDQVLENSYLHQIISTHKPDIVIDCINSATALAYQDIFSAGIKTYQDMEKAAGQIDSGIQDSVEQLLVTLYVPQLIRHIQILYESMKRAKTDVYIKIGTSGTGGMGLNIPYTHSEEKPSRMLLSKSAVAGAHSMLLWLMARTPDAPITKEIKPTAAIAWKKIEYGEILRRGQSINLYDCPPESGITLGDTLELKMDNGPWKSKGETLKSVFIDTGENGIFSLEEFRAITSRGQMEFVTPEEIAANVIYEIYGRNTGQDIINALDNATMGPTYRAGSMRNGAIRKLRKLRDENDSPSIAFELLGPPRLSKLLFEAHLLKRCNTSMEEILNFSARELKESIENILMEDTKLRSEILSIGIPILMGDGKTLYRGPEMKVPTSHGQNELEITQENIDKWTEEGWIDLREQNMSVWINRFHDIMKEIKSVPNGDTSSQYDRNYEYWRPGDRIQVGKVVGWIFLFEEEGIRMKE
jgi:hypothetical protein